MNRGTSKASGVTLVEVLAVITILAVLVALLYPVFRSVRLRMLDAQCAEKLRSFGQALAIYRAEHDGDGVYGHPAAMGLPPDGGVLKLPREVYYCPLGANAHNTFVPDPAIDDKEYFEWWKKYAQWWRDDAIVRADLNHNQWGRRVSSPYMEQKGIGLYLGGHVRIVVKQGDPADVSFWHFDDVNQL